MSYGYSIFPKNVYIFKAYPPDIPRILKCPLYHIGYREMISGCPLLYIEIHCYRFLKIQPSYLIEKIF